jgi:hypothetical protein
MAIFDIRWEIIVACFAIGAVGFIGTAIVHGRAQAKAYSRAVQQYAERVGTIPRSQEWWEKWSLPVALGLFLIFLGGSCLAVWRGNFVIALLSFVPIFLFILILGGRQYRQQEEAWRDFAARHNLSYESDIVSRLKIGPLPLAFHKPFSGPRIYGTYRKREITIEELKRRESHFDPGTGRHKSSRRSYTRITLSVDNPADFLLTRGTEIQKSLPNDFARNLFGSSDLHQRLIAVSPREIALRGQKLYLELFSLPRDLVDLQFLSDFMWDLATAIEKLSNVTHFH